MFRAHRPILRRVHTAVHTTIGSVSVLLWPLVFIPYVERMYGTKGLKPSIYVSSYSEGASFMPI